MILHSWTDDVQGNNPASKYIRPMLLVKCSNFSGPVQAAEYAVARAREGDALFLRHFGERTAGLRDVGSESLYDFLESTPGSFNDWAAWADVFWSTYAAHGGPQLGMVVLEQERGYTWFRIGANPTARCDTIEDAMRSSKFPKAVRVSYNRPVLENVWNANSPGADWVGDFSSSVQNIYYRKLYDTVSRGYYASGYVGNIFSNYGTTKTTRDYREINNWKSTRDMTSNGFGISSPPIYLNVNGSRGCPMTRYNSLIAAGKTTEAADALRAGSRVAFDLAIELLHSLPKSNIAPWLAFPLYRGDNVPRFTTYQPARALLTVMLLSGVKNVIYWASPHETPTDRAEMEKILEEIHATSSKLIMNLTPAQAYPEYVNSVKFHEIDFS